MKITRDEFIKLLDTNKIKEMEIQIEIATESFEREEDFILDKENRYLNSRIISESYDLLEIRLKTRVNHHSVIVGFGR